ncbi:alpha-2-macroglobulin family protein, partial [Arthrospira platensis SPKY2]
MVVASDNRAYGNTEKTVAVKQPLMLLATLPRVIGPGEKVRIPVNIFAGDDQIRNVTVRIAESKGMAQILGNSTQTVSFTKAGEKMAYFEAELKPQMGIARLTITAESG